MNLYENQTPNDEHWQPMTEVVFYEPRTIPAGWDLSEYLPASASAQAEAQFASKED